MDEAAERRARLLASFARRGLLATGDAGAGAVGARTGADADAAGMPDGRGPSDAPDGPLTKWGQPAWREVPAAGEPGGTQALTDASSRQTRLVELAHAVPQTGDDACAAWIEDIWASLGMGAVAGHARDLYERYCTSEDLAELKVGMAVAVPATPYSTGGLRHGHVGLYVGDGMVMDCAASTVRRVPLDLWLSTYGVMAEPRWGWLAHIDLSR